jgi:hypothetical protein
MDGIQMIAMENPHVRSMERILWVGYEPFYSSFTHSLVLIPYLPFETIHTALLLLLLMRKPFLF